MDPSSSSSSTRSAHSYVSHSSSSVLQSSTRQSSSSLASHEPTQIGTPLRNPKYTPHRDQTYSSLHPSAGPQSSLTDMDTNYPYPTTPHRTPVRAAAPQHASPSLHMPTTPSSSLRPPRRAGHVTPRTPTAISYANRNNMSTRTPQQQRIPGPTTVTASASNVAQSSLLRTPTHSLLRPPRRAGDPPRTPGNSTLRFRLPASSPGPVGHVPTNDRDGESGEFKTPDRSTTDQYRKLGHSSTDCELTPFQLDLITKTPNKEDNDEWLSHFGLDISLLKIAEQEHSHRLDQPGGPSTIELTGVDSLRHTPRLAPSARLRQVQDVESPQVLQNYRQHQQQVQQAQHQRQHVSTNPGSVVPLQRPEHSLLGGVSPGLKAPSPSQIPKPVSRALSFAPRAFESPKPLKPTTAMRTMTIENESPNQLPQRLPSPRSPVWMSLPLSSCLSSRNRNEKSAPSLPPSAQIETGTNTNDGASPLRPLLRNIPPPSIASPRGKGPASSSATASNTNATRKKPSLPTLRARGSSILIESLSPSYLSRRHRTSIPSPLTKSPPASSPSSATAAKAEKMTETETTAEVEAVTDPEAATEAVTTAPVTKTTETAKRTPIPRSASSPVPSSSPSPTKIPSPPSRSSRLDDQRVDDTIQRNKNWRQRRSSARISSRELKTLNSSMTAAKESGSGLILTPVKASRKQRQVLGSNTILTPVRRSLRLSARHVRGEGEGGIKSEGVDERTRTSKDENSVPGSKATGSNK